MRRELDGSMVRHADLSDIGVGWSEIVVDGRGNIYCNRADFDFIEGEEPKPGIIALVTPDGSARQVAGDLAFPNGMVVTPDNSTLIISESFAGRLTAFDIAADGSLSNRRVWAEGLGPDGICIDAEGAVWTSADQNACVRVREGGEVLQRIELDRSPFACMLGGPDRSTLFILATEWRMDESVKDNVVRLTTGPRTGQVLTLPAPAPGADGPRGERYRTGLESRRSTIVRIRMLVRRAGVRQRRLLLPDEVRGLVFRHVRGDRSSPFCICSPHIVPRSGTAGLIA